MSANFTVIRNGSDQLTRADTLAELYADEFGDLIIIPSEDSDDASDETPEVVELTPDVPLTPTDPNADPVAVDDTAETDSDLAVKIDLTANDTDSDGDAPLFISFLTNSVDEVIAKGTIAVNDDGTVTYDPNGAFDDLGSGDTAEDKFAYTVSDGKGGEDSGVLTVTVTGVDNVFFTVEATDADKPEGDEGLTPLVFTVRRTGDLSVSASVVATLTSSAAGGGASDLGVIGSNDVLVEFEPDETEQTVTVFVAGNRLTDGDVDLLLTLSDPQASSGGAGITVATAEGTLTDDDTASDPGEGGGSSDDRLRGTSESDILNGGEGDDKLLGFGSSDILSGDAGEDVLRGLKGVDVLNGGGDNDRVFGGRNDDVLHGDEGEDILRGGQGDDVLFGGADNDRLYGQGNNDTLFGDGGNDEIYGQGGSDLLSGDAGEDTLLGGRGRDFLIGGLDNDILRGGRGQDVLVADGGDDELYGGRGADIYVLGDDGDDMIIGFSRRQGDRLDLRDVAEVTTLAEFKARLDSSGQDTVFTADSGSTMTFVRFDADNLTEDDVIF